ncbi:MAG TPA: protein kinase [Drouetiella sp.]
MASHSLERIKKDSQEDAARQSFFVGEIPVSSEFEGRYEILEEIGKGGMGVVYKARQPALQKLYAIKMLHSVHVKETILRFEREAKAISKLDHINLITSHDFGVSTDGRPYMVMDFIEGTSLATTIKINRKLSLAQTLEICIQIARGMAYAHAQGVLHRDLKPGNIMLIKQPDGGQLVKIIDFGIAKVVEADEPHELTRTGDVFGSPYYMSPEQAVGRGIDERSDIYSLGCVMYEMLTGVVPFRGASAFETLYAHLNEPVPTLRSKAAREHFPSAVEKLVAKALAKDQKDRWQSMTDLESELNSLKRAINSPWKTLLHHLDFEAPSANKPKIGHLVAAAALVTMGIVALISFWPSSSPPVKENHELSGEEYLREQKLDDPNELAKPIILNGTTELSLEALDCSDEALKWCRERNDIVKLNLCGTSITGIGLKYLTHLPLQVLQMNQTGVSDLESLKQIPTLESLELNKTLINGSTLRAIAKLGNLKALRVQDDRLSNDAIDTIVKLPRLEYLTISHNGGINDDGIAKLMELKNLKSLRMSSMRISDDGVRNIDRLKQLRTLDLSGTNITDKTLFKLKDLPLQELFLSSTNVTDEGVRQLTKCGMLDRLALNGCPKVSKAVVSELRESLAHCRVEHSRTARSQ